ncbi:MAG: hypothetical protein RIT26_135 [Pseudomonadota bacterium]
MIGAMPESYTEATNAPVTLVAQALSARSMAPFGWVLDRSEAFSGTAGQMINAGTSRRADLPGQLALHAGGGQPLACVFRARMQDPTGPWRMLERHRLGTQTFVPLGADSPGQSVCILLVALGDAAPDERSLRAFWVGPQMAFTLKAGVWHHPLIATRECDFLVIERAGADPDCEVLPLSRPVCVHLPA